jgi:hypothetical protein
MVRYTDHCGDASAARVAANNDERGGRGIETSSAPVALAAAFRNERRSRWGAAAGDRSKARVSRGVRAD